MCGLAAVFNASSDVGALGAVEGMLRQQVHRGPDSAGVWSDRVCGIEAAAGLRRLRILDLSDAADQPMVSDDGRFVLVFNGEIYNYIELRRDLESLGVRFRTSGDTEVLLQALVRWDVDALQRFNGMWALVLVDTVRGDVLLARDRFGVKPLYTYADGGTLWIASEVKAILTASGRKFRVHATVAQAYLRQALLNTGAATFFEGIQEFPAGHFSRTTLKDAAFGRHEPRRFWTVSLPDIPLSSEEAVIESVREIFIDAVRLRLRSDVPVGVLLSGGCDSSAIAAAVHHLGPDRRDIRLISAVSDGGFDEQPFIDAMARHLDRSVEKVVLNYSPADAISMIGDAVWHNDEPIGGFSSVAHYLLMKRARDLGVTVLLSGQGADECLCGYKKYLGFYLQDLVRRGRVLSAAGVLKGFLKEQTVVSQVTLRHSKYYLPRWIRAGEVDVRGPALRSVNGWIPVGLGGMDVRQRQVRDIETLSVPALVHYEDRMSMSSSREIRLPFLDYRLVQLLVGLPVEYKLRDGWTKWVFRQAMAPLLPKSIAWRRDKQGFIVPQQTWFRSKLRDDVQRLLDEEWISEKLGILDRTAVRRRYEAYLKQPPTRGRLGVDDLFPPIALELWARRFSPFLKA